MVSGKNTPLIKAHVLSKILRYKKILIILLLLVIKFLKIQIELNLCV